MENLSSSLYFTEGSSNKEYHLNLTKDKNENTWSVTAQYGRRGQTLKSEAKSKTPLEYNEAKTLYDKVLKEKVKKGYSFDEKGGVFQSPSLEEQFSGIVPQLLNNIEPEDVMDYIQNSDYCMQEKMDGERRLIKKENNVISGINKKGLCIPLPIIVEQMFSNIGQDFVIDAEIIGDKIYAFDLLNINGENIQSLPMKSRYSQLADTLKKSKEIILVPCAFTEREKQEMYEAVENSSGEGVVFKNINSKYVAGRPASGGNQLKHKFKASATVLVTSLHKTKRSIGVAVFEEGKLVEVGNVTVYPNFEMPKVGDFVEVQYLYAYKGGSLYQSEYKGIRNDQDETDCSITQLKYKKEDFSPKKKI